MSASFRHSGHHN